MDQISARRKKLVAGRLLFLANLEDTLQDLS